MSFFNIFRRRGYVWQPALDSKNGSQAVALMAVGH